MSIDLNIIIPVYNESEIIDVVIQDWIQELSKLNISLRLNLYNDGSKDKTLDVLRLQQLRYPERIKVVNKDNTGHGPTILTGYGQNLDSEWVFQVDSDNEIKAKYFGEFWGIRDGYDFIIGKRVNRDAPFFRKFMAYFSQLLVLMMYGKGVQDVNCPFRLMKISTFWSIFESIPTNTFAPNVIISGMAVKNKVGIKNLNIQFQKRTTGVNSLNSNYFKLIKICLKSFLQTIKYAKR